MKEIIYNYDFLKESEVTETVIRTKAVLVTESGMKIVFFSFQVDI